MHEKKTRSLFVASDFSTTPRIPIKVTATSMVVRPPQQMFRRPKRSTEAATRRIMTSWIPFVSMVMANGSAIPAVEKK